MSTLHSDSDADVSTAHTEAQTRLPMSSVSAEKERKRSPSMHDGIAVWCDCCSCEAEPYWIDIAAEMGMELGSDYEDLER